ncbi:MAG: aminotransferase class III-fold pyridoxal phosphate-dependent enzyme [Thermoanaerobacteraceae bacterium]|nr:aminotransferase class III-fold pyridoxal phosphate-dependent enzyme [Thermoanaerobacteraceae bacterium]
MDKKDLELLEELFPGVKDAPMTSEYWTERAKKIIGISTQDRDIYPVLDHTGARGNILRDIEGNEYLDATSGVAVRAIGFRNPDMVDFEEKIKDVAEEFPCQDFDAIPQTLLAEKLASITPGYWDKQVFFTTSGARAIETAIKSVIDRTHKFRFVGFRPTFHGRTGYALSFTASKSTQRNYFPQALPIVRVPYAYCYRCPYHMTQEECKEEAYCVNEIRRALEQEGTDIAGILFEPISGEGGIVVPPASFVKGLRQVADEYGAELICDEVQAGMGRTGKWWAVENYEVAPDSICTAKALGAGYPMGATIGKSPMFTKGSRHSETFSAEPRMALMSLFMINYIEKNNLMENAKNIGSYMLARLQELRDKYEIVGDARGIGLMMGIEIVENKKTKKMSPEKRDEVIYNAVNKEKLMILGAGTSSIRLLPALNYTLEEAEEVLNRLERAIQAVK